MRHGVIARGVRALLVVLVLAVAGSGFATASAGAEPNYVALGDSYASGPLIPVPVPPYGCLRSSSDYANLAALRMKLALRDMTCAGASTHHMYDPHGVTPGPANPPQLSALDADTRLVTLQILGNDIGFGSLAVDCLNLLPASGSPCRDKYVVDGVDTEMQRIADDAPRVGQVIRDIRARSPLAKILVLDYPAIFPHTGGGCYPLLPVAEGDVPWLRSIHVALNTAIRDQALANGATFVDLYAASVGKDACKLPVLRWVEPAVPVNLAAPVHPNLTGMLAFSQMVVAAAGQPAADLDSTVKTVTTLVGSLIPRFG
jgi:lysophospholipase L1-like esterase